MIIAIDGPSGAGKSTLGKMLAKRLGLLYIDTGAMYRAAGLAVTEQGISLEDETAVLKAVKDAKIELIGEPDSLKVILNGRDVSSTIRSQPAAKAASHVSTISEVRQIMVRHQQEMGTRSPKGAVLEGRDIGTVVFPNADVKFFLTARPEARARRRFSEDTEKGRATTYEQTLAEISERDGRDVSREDSPLMIADDADVIDTSELDLAEVFEQMMEKINNADSASA